MPYYDYHCAANDRTVEVRHPMSATVRTWGQLCELAGLAPGDTPADATVERKLAAPVPLTSKVSETPSEPCGPSCACALD